MSPTRTANGDNWLRLALLLLAYSLHSLIMCCEVETIRASVCTALF